MEFVRININMHPFALFIIPAVMIAFIFLIGFSFGISVQTPKVKIEEPEVYAHFLQELESIPEIESFGVDRRRYSGSYTNWSLSVHMNDDASFYFNKLESIDEINESIEKVRHYVKSLE